MFFLPAKLFGTLNCIALDTPLEARGSSIAQFRNHTRVQISGCSRAAPKYVFFRLVSPPPGRPVFLFQSHAGVPWLDFTDCILSTIVAPTAEIRRGTGGVDPSEGIEGEGRFLSLLCVVSAVSWVLEPPRCRALSHE